MNMVNFLVLGAHKSGTTYIYNLLKHDDSVYVHPFKEINYFRDLDKGFDRQKIKSTEDWFCNKVIDKRMQLSREDLVNLGKFVFTPIELRNDIWYKSLFETEKKYASKGEVCPSYSLLSRKTFKKIRKLNPHVKLIFVMRNPIDRVCSAFSFDKLTAKFFGGKPLEESEVTNEIIREYYKSEACESRTRYDKTIRLVNKFFPKENIRYIFFEDLMKNKKVEVDRFLKFIGSNSSFLSITKVTDTEKKVLPSTKYSFPEEIKKEIRVYYSDVYDYIFKYFDNVPTNWK